MNDLTRPPLDPPDASKVVKAMERGVYLFEQIETVAGEIGTEMKNYAEELEEWRAAHLRGSNQN